MLDENGKKTSYLVKLLALPYVAFSGVFGEREDGTTFYSKRRYRLFFTPAMGRFTALALIVGYGILFLLAYSLVDGPVSTPLGPLPSWVVAAIAGLLFLLLPLGMKGETLPKEDWFRLATGAQFNSDDRRAFRKALWWTTNRVGSGPVEITRKGVTYTVNRVGPGSVEITRKGVTYTVVSGGWSFGVLGWWFMFLFPRNQIFYTFDGPPLRSLALMALILFTEAALLLILDYYTMHFKVIHPGEEAKSPHLTATMNEQNDTSGARKPAL